MAHRDWGKAWMASGGRLYRYCPNFGGGWRRIVDFGRSGVQEISRLTFSPDGKTLAFVADRATPPPDGE